MRVFEIPSVSCNSETPCSPLPSKSRICNRAGWANALQRRACRSKTSLLLLAFTIPLLMTAPVMASVGPFNASLCGFAGLSEKLSLTIHTQRRRGAKKTCKKTSVFLTALPSLRKTSHVQFHICVILQLLTGTLLENQVSAVESCGNDDC